MLNDQFVRVFINDPANVNVSNTFSTNDTSDHFSVNEVIRELKLIKKNTPGPDMIPGQIYRLHADIFAPVLTHIFNMSISTCTFPRVWKQANILPVKK